MTDGGRPGRCADCPGYAVTHGLCRACFFENVACAWAMYAGMLEAESERIRRYWLDALDWVAELKRR